MHVRSSVIGMVGVILVAAGCASGGEPADEPRLPVQRFELAADTVRVSALVGEVRVERAASGPTVVEVTRVGEDAAMLTLDSATAVSTSAVRIRFSGQRISTRLGERGTTRVSVAEDGRFGGGIGGRTVEITTGRGGVRARSDLVIRVPENRTLLLDLAVGKLTLSGVNGSVRVNASSAEVTADSSRGALALDVREGSVRVSTFRGALDVTTERARVAIAQTEGSHARIRADTGSVTVSGSDAARLEVRSTSAPVQLSGIRSAVTSVESNRGRVSVSVASAVDSVRIITETADAALVLVGDLRSGALIRSTSGNVLVRLAPTFSARVQVQGELRSPTVELALGGLERVDRGACAAVDDAPPVAPTCNVVRGEVGDGGALIHAESRRGDVRLAGF